MFTPCVLRINSKLGNLQGLALFDLGTCIFSCPWAKTRDVTVAFLQERGFAQQRAPAHPGKDNFLFFCRINPLPSPVCDSLLAGGGFSGVSTWHHQFVHLKATQMQKNVWGFRKRKSVFHCLECSYILIRKRRMTANPKYFGHLDSCHSACNSKVFVEGETSHPIPSPSSAFLTGAWTKNLVWISSFGQMKLVSCPVAGLPSLCRSRAAGWRMEYFEHLDYQGIRLSFFCWVQKSHLVGCHSPALWYNLSLVETKPVWCPHWLSASQPCVVCDAGKHHPFLLPTHITVFSIVNNIKA